MKPISISRELLEEFITQAYEKGASDANKHPIGTFGPDSGKRGSKSFFMDIFEKIIKNKTLTEGKQMNEIWLLLKHSSPHYRTVGVFTSKEKAEEGMTEYRKHNPKDKSFMIQSWTIDQLVDGADGVKENLGTMWGHK